MAKKKINFLKDDEDFNIHSTAEILSEANPDDELVVEYKTLCKTKAFGDLERTALAKRVIEKLKTK